MRLPLLLEPGEVAVLVPGGRGLMASQAGHRLPTSVSVVGRVVVGKDTLDVNHGLLPRSNTVGVGSRVE